MKVSRNDLIWCIIVSVIYILWVIWLGNYWWLFGLPVIFDIYISKKVNWTFWKKRDGKNNKFIEWLDALIFAVIAVTLINIFLFQNYKIPTGSMENTMLIGDHLYVSKVAYGPRIPNTPLAFPFTQNTLPLTKGTKSYLEWIKLPYKRLAGFGRIKRDDIVVFNFPAGDTIVVGYTNLSYYSIIRDSMQYHKNMDARNGVPPRTEKEYYALARKGIWENFTVIARPVDRRDNYIKRCVAIPGDTMQIINRQVYINGKPENNYPGIQFGYYIYLNGGQTISDQVFNRMSIYDYQRDYTGTSIHAYLTPEEVGQIQRFSNVREIQLNHYFDDYNIDYFPNDTNYKWTLNNFGPLYIPGKGATIEINTENLCLYERIIGYYEGNDLSIENGQIYINGQPAREYTFKMDYYWMMGDNRHSSLDSRFWGFVPEDHIVGKPKFVWLSLDKNQKFLKRIRFRRMFRKIE
ncbi:MAG: S26 family signal peptidase [Bacteroidales bacterium]|nr:S26 family signal peptidase [Bacteroidales bacterium]